MDSTDALTTLLTSISRFMNSITLVLETINERLKLLEEKTVEVRGLWVLAEDFQKRLHVLEDNGEHCGDVEKD
jgi:hypothetical protein